MLCTTMQALPRSQDPDSEPSISITLRSPASVVGGRLEKTSNVDIWSPLEELSGIVKITSREHLTMQQVQISFEGRIPPELPRRSPG